MPLTQSCQQMPPPTWLPQDGARRDRAAGPSPASCSPSPCPSPHPALTPPSSPPGAAAHMLLNLKLFPLYAASQAFPSGQGKKPHQKNISLLIWVPTAFLNGIPTPQACSLSLPPHTLTATSGSLPGSVGPGLGSEASASFLSLS